MANRQRSAKSLSEQTICHGYKLRLMYFHSKYNQTCVYEVSAILCRPQCANTKFFADGS